MVSKESSSESYRARWGVPDWEDGNTYPGKDDLTIDEWRWEFLRRSEGYREDFLKPDESFIGESKGRYFEQTHFVLNIIDPARSVDCMKTPNDNQDDEFQFAPGFDVRFIDTDEKCLYGYPFTGELPLGAAKVSNIDLRVDLQMPLRPQMQRLGRIAKRAQTNWMPSIKRPNIDQWKTYLRILDARGIGIAFREIGQIVFGKEDYDEAAKRAHDAHTAAKTLINNFPKFNEL